MKEKYSLDTSVKNLIEVFKANNLSIQEIQENTGVEEPFLEMVFSNTDNFITKISRLFEFANIRITSRNMSFSAYKIFTDKEEPKLKVTRVIEPRCSMYYDRTSHDFYNFSMRLKNHNVSDVRIEIYKEEMRDFVDSYLLESL